MASQEITEQGLRLLVSTTDVIESQQSQLPVTVQLVTATALDIQQVSVHLVRDPQMNASNAANLDQGVAISSEVMQLAPGVTRSLNLSIDLAQFHQNVHTSKKSSTRLFVFVLSIIQLFTGGYSPSKPKFFIQARVNLAEGTQIISPPLPVAIAKS